MPLRKATHLLPIRHWGSQQPSHPLPPLVGEVVFTLAVNSSVFCLHTCHCRIQILNGEAEYNLKEASLVIQAAGRILWLGRGMNLGGPREQRHRQEATLGLC